MCSGYYKVLLACVIPVRFQILSCSELGLGLESGGPIYQWLSFKLGPWGVLNTFL
jgi:hypothetical protein